MSYLDKKSKMFVKDDTMFASISATVGVKGEGERGAIVRLAWVVFAAGEP